ncbi:hypothetical protein K7X08_007249 [Anisodus acutangulus]|uniref:Aminotransferase class I/classII large domain-containing protein n=1 Tax=Anisodus acutangulus TaxID=402998 RepID=A0A9Q1LCA5_9SOLA|nr:hypothetical protein K7X08_007249 [Anisodus acutangulus]
MFASYTECDSAYQRFPSGNLDADAQFVVDDGECLAAQSYARNMRLYGERGDALSIVCKDADVASSVESQLKLVIRPMYSNSSIHGLSSRTVPHLADAMHAAVSKAA